MSAECTDYVRVQPDWDPGRRIFYSSELSNIALERCRTAREAVDLVGALIDRYGFYGTGETLLFADPEEAWAMEMCGYDMNGTGGLWAAERIPDGHVFVAANTFRIRDLDPSRTDQVFSANLPAVAEQKGWWRPADGKLDWLGDRLDGRVLAPLLLALARLAALRPDGAVARPLAVRRRDLHDGLSVLCDSPIAR